MSAFVDVQGFKAPPRNTFIVKEVAVLMSDEIVHFMILSPLSWDSLPQKYKRINTYLTRNHHGLQWSKGDVQLHVAKNKLKSIDATRYYVKGDQKKMWCEKLFPWMRKKIINVEEKYDIEKIKSFSDENHCRKHQGVCAKNNVFVLSKLIPQIKFNPIVHAHVMYEDSSYKQYRREGMNWVLDAIRFREQIRKTGEILEPVLKAALEKMKLVTSEAST